MKKTIAAVSVLAISLSMGSAVMAKPDNWEGGRPGMSQGKKTGLENALDRVKNPRARAAIERAMERKAEKDKEEEKPVEVVTDEQITAADQAWLKVGFNGTDTLSSVTQALKLPTAGKYGSVITWVSSNTAVVSHDGKTVVRPASADVKVVLTATITKNQVSVVKTFEVTVKHSMNDAQIVAADKAALTIGYTGTDTASAVTLPLKLSTKGTSGASITWLSSNTAVISNDGKTVTRPAYGQGDAVVTLIASIKSNNVTDVKLFTVTVKQQYSDTEKVAADKASLAIGFSEGDTTSHVTKKLTLPLVGTYGSTVAWISSNPTVISNDGQTVVRPAAGLGDVNVTFTATIRSGTALELKTFTVTVKQQLTDAQKAAADKAALNIGFSGSDTAASVTSKLILPVKGANGSNIMWYSSDAAVVTDNGTVIRPAAGTGDKSVTLNAIIVSGGSVETKSFVVNVKQL